MLTRLINKAEAVALIERCEDHFYDQKSVAVSGAKVQRALVAFANSDGGELLVGIEDLKQGGPSLGRWQGHGNVEEFNGIVQAIYEVRPQLPCSMEFLAVQDLPGIIMLVRVDKSAQVHSTSAGSVFVRQGAQCLPLGDPERLAALQFAKGLKSFEDTAVPNVPPELIVDSEPLRLFLDGYSPRISAIGFCVNENLIDLTTWDPKVCGLVLFCAKPFGRRSYQSGRSGFAL